MSETIIHCFIDSYPNNPYQDVIHDRQIDQSLAYDGDCIVVAVANEELIASHYSSSEAWAKHDIGFTSEWKHDKYRELFPDGFQLVWGLPNPIALTASDVVEEERDGV